MDNNKINFFGLTSFRNEKKRFGIKQDDRRRHFYTIGKTGMGKSNLMENMAIQDIQNGHGLAYVDPHGEGAEKLLDFIPEERINDVIFLNPADLDFPIAFNIMEKVDFKYRHLVAGGLMGVFKKVWPDVWSARMEYILNNSILALLEYPDSTLLGVNRMLADPKYRAKVVAKVQDPIVKAFWVTEYARYTQRYEIEATAAIQNKVGQFVSNALIRNIIGQTQSSVNMRTIMDEKKILILDLSKGRIGEDNSRLLGALLITKIQLAAMSRVDIPEPDRQDFYLYVDEFQNFATESFAGILSEARKYRLNLTLGHQYIAQMDEIVRDAVFGNVGTLAVFRVGAEDAEFLEREFSPEFTAEDLVNLSKYNIYLKLMIDGVASHPFSAQTLPPPTPSFASNRDKIIAASRATYGFKKEVVESKITAWTENQDDDPVDPNQPRSQSDRGSAMNESGQKKPVTKLDTAAFVPKVVPLQQNQEPQVMYDAICSRCQKPIKIIFKPEPGKPVYCKSCLKKIKREAEEKAHGGQNPAHGTGQMAHSKEQMPSPLKESIQPQAKIENVPSRMFNARPQDPGQKKKSINLSDLKKAIDDSLEHQKPSEVPEPSEVPVKKPSQTPGKEQKSNDDKKQGVINPGEKVSL